MAKARTWIWIIVGCLAVMVIGLFAIAGAGVYFVASHIDTERLGSTDAMKRFDDARAVFKDQPPLIELDSDERPNVLRRTDDLPRSPVRPTELQIMVWDSDEERIVQIGLPFWLLKLGGRDIDIDSGDFRFDDLNLDIEELERIGPVLVCDFSSRSGERVLLWTQ